MPTTTTNYGLLKPLVNDPTDQDLWGTQLNSNMDTLDSILYSFFPAGIIFDYGGSSAPSGFLECDGAAVSRSTYARLFTAIGTTYGAGDGVTTFNVPDFRAMFRRGWDHGKGIDSGRTLGSYQADDTASHSHAITDPGHSHYIDSASNLSAGGATLGNLSATGGGLKLTNSSTTGITGTNASGGTETRPKNVAVMAIIKT